MPAKSRLSFGSQSVLPKTKVKRVGFMRQSDWYWLWYCVPIQYSISPATSIVAALVRLLKTGLFYKLFSLLFRSNPIFIIMSSAEFHVLTAHSSIRGELDYPFRFRSQRHYNHFMLFQDLPQEKLLAKQSHLFFQEISSADPIQ